MGVLRTLLADSTAVARKEGRRLSVAAPSRAAAIGRMQTQLLRLQLRAAQCLGDMPCAAAAHAGLARSLGAERAWHVEILAHWLAYLRAGGAVGHTFPMREINRFSKFWFDGFLS